MTPTIAIIGAGNMGSCLINGLIKSGHPANKIWATAKHPERIKKLAENFSIHTTLDNNEAAKNADIIIFAVKPLIISMVAAELKNTIQQHKPLIISVASGIREKKIQGMVGENIAIVRAMPNTPAFVGSGATGLHANTNTSSEQRNMAESIFRSVGLVVWVDNEEMLDTITALSGCGPAYFFLMMEALQEAAEELGLPTKTARLLTLQTALGAAHLAMESDKSLEELRHHVTSPGGATEKALSVFEERRWEEIIKHALIAAKKRAEELAEI